MTESLTLGNLTTWTTRAKRYGRTILAREWGHDGRRCPDCGGFRPSYADQVAGRGFMIARGHIGPCEWGEVCDEIRRALHNGR